MREKQIGGCLGLWAKGGMDYNSEAGGIFRGTEFVNILIVAVSPVFPSVRIHKIVHLNRQGIACKLNFRKLIF